MGPPRRRPCPWRGWHQAAIRAGIDTIEHASLVDAEGIRLAVARKQPVWFSMDIYNTEYTQAEGRKNGELEENIRKDREIAQVQRDGFPCRSPGGRANGVRLRRRRHAARPDRPPVRDNGHLWDDSA